MEKYIDADLLRKEIERRIKIYSSYEEKLSRVDELGKLLSFLDSLQQEQQEVDLDKEIEEYWIATEWSKKITLGKFKVIARYFYGLGQLNSK